MEINFKIIQYGSSDWKKAVQLREDILRRPLGGSFSPKELDEEKNQYHVGGLANGELIATAVLVPEKLSTKMQRVVVIHTLRNLSIGSGMMAFCEKYARDKGHETIYCHARDSAVHFYVKNGYLQQGDYFEEDGIPHLKMFKSIAKKEA